MSSVTSMYLTGDWPLGQFIYLGPNYTGVGIGSVWEFSTVIPGAK
jgi:hypothetical protein